MPEDPNAPETWFKFCPWDGTKIEEGWIYCPECGRLMVKP